MARGLTTRAGAAGLRPLGAAFALFGVFWGVASVAAADIERDLGLTHAAFGALLSAALAAGGVANVVAGVLAERHGGDRMLAGALATWGVLIGAAASLAHARPVFVVLFVLAVAAGGAVDVGLNILATAAFSGSPGRLVRFHARFNAGAAVGAGGVGLVLGAGASWRWAWAVIAAVALALSVAVATTRQPAGGAGEHIPFRTAFTLLVRERLVVVALAFALGAIAEGGIEVWGVLYLRSRLESGLALGATSAVLGYAVAAVARLTLGNRAGSLGTARGAAAGATGAAAGLVLMVVAPTAVLAGLGLVIAAASVSLCWPLLIAHAAASRERPGAVVGAMASFGYAGIVLGPAVAGNVAGVAGLRAALVFLIAVALGSAVAAASRR